MIKQLRNINVIKVTQNSVLILLSVIFSLVFVELALQLTNIGKYSLYDRILFFTKPSLVKATDTTVRYQPRTKIRSVAIYGDQIDYDVSYNSNNLGFIDNVDYDLNSSATNKIVFVGDSFTAGVGGSKPWISQIRELTKRDSTDFYGFGVSGTGISHFESLLRSFKDKMAITEINIMVISNDFFRTFWYPVVRGDSMWFCRQTTVRECLDNNLPVIHIAGQDATQDELLARAKDLYKKKANNISSARVFRLYTLFCDNMYSFWGHQEFVGEHFCPHLRVRHVKYKKDEIYKKSLSMLKSIKNHFPNVVIRVVHIPEKGETFNNTYSLGIRNDIRKIGLEYIPLLELCDWTRTMYHKHDGHLNDLGYANLIHCLLAQGIGSKP